jgi:hypothetical protein
MLTCNDNIMNFGETAMDCGGAADSGCPRCAAGLPCVANVNCLSGICDNSTLTCATPSPTPAPTPGGVFTRADAEAALRISQQVVVPEGFVEVGESAFMDLPVTSVTIANSVRVLSRAAFLRCEFLKSVHVGTGSSLNRIRSSAFTQSGIESFFFPRSLGSFGVDGGSFDNTLNLRTVAFDAFTGLNSLPAGLFASSPALTGQRIILPASIFTVGLRAFRGLRLEQEREPLDNPLALSTFSIEGPQTFVVDCSDPDSCVIRVIQFEPGNTACVPQGCRRGPAVP